MSIWIVVGCVVICLAVMLVVEWLCNPARNHLRDTWLGSRIMSVLDWCVALWWKVTGRKPCDSTGHEITEGGLVVDSGGNVGEVVWTLRDAVGVLYHELVGPMTAPTPLMNTRDPMPVTVTRRAGDLVAVAGVQPSYRCRAGDVLLHCYTEEDLVVPCVVDSSTEYDAVVTFLEDGSTTEMQFIRDRCYLVNR